MIKETRRINREDLRKLCIKHNWYTKGSNAEYEKLLKYANGREGVSTAQIVAIADNIKAHSETDYEVVSICYEIGKICISNFFVEE